MKHIIDKLKQSLSPRVAKPVITVCNYSNNYYADQICIKVQVEQR